METKRKYRDVLGRLDKVIEARPSISEIHLKKSDYDILRSFLSQYGVNYGTFLPGIAFSMSQKDDKLEITYKGKRVCQV